MKAKNRIGVFDLLVRRDEMIGTRAYIWITHMIEIDDNGNNLPCLMPDCASYGELKGQVDALKHDLDVLVERAKQYFD